MKLFGKKKPVDLRFGILCLAVFFLVSGAGIIFSSSVSAQDELKATKAPVNEEFLKYLEIQRTGGFWQNYTEDGYPLGDIPGPLDINYTDTGTFPEIDNLAKVYDLRNKNKLTSVKDQGSCGSCWAFATYGALESSLKPKQKWDFAEQHLIKYHGLKWKACKGGNIYLSMAYLLRWAGPASEENFPYKYMPDAGTPQVEKHVQTIRLIPKRSNYTNNIKIKQAIKKLGAVYVSMYYSSECMNYATNAYYNKCKKEGGHAVLCAGWDDNYNKNNFNTPPPKNGAFIVRNSWGENWGEAGFFYVSYYDEYFARRGFSMAFKKPEATTNYDEIYLYDPQGWVNSYGYSSSDTGWFANIFTAVSNSPIKAVGFYGAGSTNNYTVYVCTNVDNDKPRSGKLAATKSGKFSYPGYFTVSLGKNVAVKKGQKFAVVVKLKTKGNNWPIPVEYFCKGYTKNIKGAKGESFLSNNGTTWEYATDYQPKMNVCLKAYAKK